ncbi:DUF3179 domain-containing protein [Yoonia sp.]|uniref:DUF3179 domain-containing protein n=1 Tax=Yoonia sp. TaxID=2212373 RepID=UPI003A4DBB7C
MMRPIASFAVLALTATAGFADPDFWRGEWPDTDFETTILDDWSEVISGGPPKDGIPALDDPSFISAADDTRLTPLEPVITLEIEGHVPRAYPIRYLTWHEIVNDVVGDMPVAVTFCPLCNSGISFDRRTDAGLLSFGVSGKLRHSDMIMYDRETESWWQQATGDAIVGRLTGTDLQTLPSWMESWDMFRSRNPDGLVMDEPPFNRNYGANPYVRYDTSQRPFLFAGEMPPHDIPALARVVRVGERAWPLTRLSEAGQLTEADVTLTWVAGQASALDTAQIGAGRDVGNVRVQDAAGQDLPHDVMFAFAFHAFWPDGSWMLGE